MKSVLAPFDDPIVKVHYLRLWRNETVVVFLYRKDWSRISVREGLPMLVEFCGKEFPTEILGTGEHHPFGRPSDGTKPSSFPVDGDQDYVDEATARIDWDNAIPSFLRDSILGDPVLLKAWQSLICAEMRDQINFIKSARKPSSQMDRQLAVIAKLRALGEQ